MGLNGQTVTIERVAAPDPGPAGNLLKVGAKFEVEGLWKDITGRSWMNTSGNYAVHNYAYRAGLGGLPLTIMSITGRSARSASLSMRLSLYELTGR